MARRLFSVPSPLLGDEPWLLVSFCIPDTPDWRRLIYGWGDTLTYGRAYDEQTGYIKQAQTVGREIFASMSMCRLDHIIIAHRLLIGAITGTAVNLDDPLPDSGIVDFSATGLAAQLRTIDADKRLADVVEDLDLSVTNQVNPAVVNVTNEVDPAAVNVTNEVNPADVSVNVSNTVKCGCGCGGGSEPPSEPATEGDPPPLGWDPPTNPDTGDEILPGSPEYQSRKCKLANLIHTQVRNGLDQIRGTAFWGISIEFAINLFGNAYLSVIGLAIGVIIGELITPIPILDGLAGGIIGFVTGIVTALIDENVDLDTLVIQLDAQQQDLVCALYSSTGVIDSVQSYTQVLNDVGINLKTQAVISAFLIPDLVNILYFKNSQYEVEIEQALDGYVGPVDCNLCGCSPIILFGGENDDPYGVMNSELFPTSGKYYISINYNCALTSFRVANISGYSPAQNISGNDWVISPDSTISSGRIENVYESMTPPPDTYNNVWSFSFRSETPFSITLEVTQ